MTKRSSQNTCWQKCLELLMKRYPYWLPGWAFTPPSIGGLNATRRVRELRTKFGIPIEVKHFPVGIAGQIKGIPIPKEPVWLYRLGCPPDEIDLEHICLKPKSVEPKEKQLNLI